MVWGALAGAGLSLGAGLLGKHDADEAFRLARSRGKKSIDRFQRPLDAAHFGRIEDFLRMASQSQVGGYDNALAELSKTGRASRRNAIGESNQALSQGLQGLASSGLGSSTLSQNYRSGAANQLSQSLAGIDENLAGLRSNLLIGRGQAQGQGYASLADLYGQRQRRDAELEAQRYQLLTGSPAPSPSFDLSGIANFASLFGGGGGGGLGGGNYFGGATTPEGGAAGMRLLDRYG